LGILRINLTLAGDTKFIQEAVSKVLNLKEAQNNIWSL
jgi:hypothetical protein